MPKIKRRTLEILVGALVLGSALPHALRAASVAFDWTLVFHAVAAASAAGKTRWITGLTWPASISGHTCCRSARASSVL